MMLHKKSFACGMLFIVCGGMLYALFRSRQTLMLKMADATPLAQYLTDLRETAEAWHPSGWVVYCMPGALWSAAYILIIHGVMHSLGTGVRWRWACVIPFTGAFSELGQAAGIVPGTFDMLDLAGYLLPLVVYSLFCKFNHSMP